MKMLLTFNAIPTITANTANVNFPVANVKDNDPFVRWVATQYAVDEFILIDFGSQTALDSIFLNQCNFPQCKIQGNATNNWDSSPMQVFDSTVNLVKDDADNRKGFFDITGFNCRWMRILIAAGQTLDNSEAFPAVGNVILGNATAGPKMNQFVPIIMKVFDEYTTENGAYVQTPKYGRARHSISITCNDTLAVLRAFPKNWSIGVFFADLAYVDEAYLVYPPKEWNPPVRNILDSSMSWTMQERP